MKRGAGMKDLERCDRELAAIRAQQGQSGMNDGDRWGVDLAEIDWRTERDLILLGVEIRNV